MGNKFENLRGDQRMDAMVREGEPVIMSKGRLITIVIVCLLTGACFGAGLMLEYIPWQ